MIGLIGKVRLFILGATRRRAGYPWQLQVELTNKCNLNCRMCLRDLLKVPRVDMSSEVFAALVGNLKNVNEVVLRGWGEPLIHPEFQSYAERIGKEAPHLSLRITTNGHLLCGETVRRIVRLKMDKVTVSIDQMNGGNGNGHPGSETVANNLKAFAKERGLSSRPQLILQPTLHQGGLTDILDVVRFAGDIGAEMVNLIRLDAHLAAGVARPDSEEEENIVMQAKKAARGKTKIFFLNQKSLPVSIASHRNRLCLRTLFHAYIDVYGNVTPCCMLREQIMGNLLEQPLEDIWRSGKFARFFREQERFCSGCDAFFSIYHE